VKILNINDYSRSHVIQVSLSLAVILSLFTACAPSSSLPPGSSQTRSSVASLMPGNNVWKVPIDRLPVDSHSANYIRSIGADKGMHLDFGSGTYDGSAIGIPITVLDGRSPVKLVQPQFDYADESDKGPYPIPANLQVEGGGDRHVIILDPAKKMLYEMFDVRPNGKTFEAGSGAIFDLTKNDTRPVGWTSADAAGLPIAPGLVQYDELMDAVKTSGDLGHAVRFTVQNTRNVYVWPATHAASDKTSSDLSPMGQRFRLRKDFSIENYSPEIQVILRTLKKYGMILADNGSDWFLSGTPDERWNNDMLNEFKRVRGAAFEAVDTKGIESSNSYSARGF